MKLLAGEQEAARAAQEITSLQEELARQKAAAERKSAELYAAQQQLDTLQLELSERETTVSALQTDKHALEMSLEELDAQHSQAIQEIIRKRDSLTKANEELQGNVKELEEKLNESLREKDVDKVEVATRSKELEKLKEELRKAEQEAQLLKTEKDHKWEDLAEMKEKLNQGAVALNELHMDKKELEERTQKLQSELKQAGQKVGELAKEKRSLEEMQKQMEEELNTTKQELNALKSEDRHQLQHELFQLRESLNDSQKLSSAYDEKVGRFEEELRKLQERLSETDQERLQLSSALENSCLTENQLKEEFEAKVKHFEEEIASLKAQKVVLEKELDTAETRQRDQAKQYENCIRELRQARDKDASSLQAEHEDLIKQNHDRDLKISELGSQCTQLRTQVADTKELLQDALSGQNHLKDMLNDKGNEVSELRGENEALKSTLEQTIAKSQRFQTELDKTRDLENEIENLKLQFESKDSETQIIDLEAQIASLQSSIEEKNSKIEAYEKQMEEPLESQTPESHTDPAIIKQYEDTIQEHQSSISFLKYDLSAKNTELQQATEKVKRLSAEVKEYKEKVAELSNAKEISDGTSSNSDDGSSSQATELQVEELRNIIAQKDDIVNELRSNNDALLRLLEERSLQLHGDKSLVEMHKLENQVRSLKMEKEQIMNVLNEKSRECSSLKGEVHRLMNVVSQEKAALSKLQQDNQDLLTTKTSDNRVAQAEDGNREMTKEAVKRLSQIIRDKDLEIESLTQKNGTLLQVRPAAAPLTPRHAELDTRSCCAAVRERLIASLVAGSAGDERTVERRRERAARDSDAGQGEPHETGASIGCFVVPEDAPTGQSTIRVVALCFSRGVYTCTVKS